MTTRQKAIQIFTAAVNAVQPSQLIPAHLFIKGNTLYIFDQHFLLNELMILLHQLRNILQWKTICQR